MSIPKPRLPMREVPWPPGGCTTTCPLCGGYWRPFAGSFLPAHAKCLFSPEDKERIRQMVLSSTKRLDDTAAELGIPTQIVRAIILGRR